MQLLGVAARLEGCSSYYSDVYHLIQEGWKGVAAKPPSVPEYQTALTSDLFVYLGHGSGKEFLGGRQTNHITIP